MNEKKGLTFARGLRSTVHANNVIGRFIHMGVDPYSLFSAMNGIMAQRLPRVSGPHCAEVRRLQAETDVALDAVSAAIAAAHMSWIAPGDAGTQRPIAEAGHSNSDGFRLRKGPLH